MYTHLRLDRSQVVRSIVAGGVVAGLLFVSALGAAAAPVGADPTPTPEAAAPAQSPQQIRSANDLLEKRLAREQRSLAHEQQTLDRANKLAAKAQQRIDRRKAKGLDTSQLEAMLSAFKTAVGSAQGSFDSAKATLDAKAGFDSGGHVTDKAQARSTVTAAHSALAQFRETMKGAVSGLTAGMKELGQEARLSLEQKGLGWAQKRLDRANATVARIQTLVTDQKAEGKDTSQVEAALEGFKTALASAQTSYNSAKATLDAKAGFDSAGKVTDSAQAETTLDSARQALRQMNQTLTPAAKALAQAVKDFRAANKS